MKSHRMHARLVAMERAVADRVLHDCAECRGPVPGANVYVFAEDDGRLAFGACGSCGLALDEHGRALAPRRLKKGERRGHPKAYWPGLAEVIARM